MTRNQKQEPDYELKRSLLETRHITASGCWELSTEASTFRSRKAYILSARLWLNFVPDLKAKTCVRHLCHNRKCFNPRHLKKGTYRDNTWDRIKAGRGPIAPEDAIVNRTTPGDRELIKELWKKSLDAKAIADRYNISFGSVYRIVKGHYDL